VKVKVLEVDVARKRIALTMRLDDALPTTDGSAPAQRNDRNRPGAGKPAYNKPTAPQQPAVAKTGSFGNLLQDALKKR
jgi:uncharacterized protein